VLTKEFHTNAAVMGVLLSAFSWSYTLLNIPAGMLVDRIRTRFVYTGAMVLWGVASFLTALTSSIGAMFGPRLLLGVAESPFIPAAVRTISDPQRRGARADPGRPGARPDRRPGQGALEHPDPQPRHLGDRRRLLLPALHPVHVRLLAAQLPGAGPPHDRAEVGLRDVDPVDPRVPRGDHLRTHVGRPDAPRLVVPANGGAWAVTGDTPVG
jgi:hypothetical protein